MNAIYVTGLFSFLLSLIYIGSEVAFYAITSLFTVALLQCYMFSIGSILWRRIYLPETIPECSFGLGRWGIPINATAVIWCAWSFVSSNCLLRLLKHECMTDTAILVLVFLAAGDPNAGGGVQLVFCHIWRRGCYRGHLLLLPGSQDLSWPSGVGEEGIREDDALWKSASRSRKILHTYL